MGVKSYGNNTLMICCLAGTILELRSQDIPAPDKISLRCCCSHSLPTMINPLTHWGWVTHICVGKLTIIASDNGLSPGRRQAIIWSNAGMLIGPLGTKFNEILIEIHTFSFKKMHLKMLSAKWRPFWLGPNVLTPQRQKPAFLMKSISW